MTREKLAILNAGSQFAKVIDRRIRELGVESHILDMDTPAKDLEEYKAIIISGGPESVYGENAPKYDPEVFNLNKPIFGICYGMQLLNYIYGGKVGKKEIREDGVCDIEVISNSLLLDGFKKNEEVLMSHGDSVLELSDQFKTTSNSGEIIASVEHLTKPIVGVQFHPEVDLTKKGKQIFKNFLFKIAGFKGDFTVANREEEAIKEIQETVGQKDVLVLISGGVDSAVLGALINKALPKEQIHAIHINSGFMRLGESEKVISALSKVGLDVKMIDASKTFYNATTLIDGKETKKLNQTTSPQEKRKIIGDTFIKVSQKIIQDLNLDENNVFLAQGTLRPDLIESASKTVSNTADVIKTHHNDTDLVRKLRDEGKVIEPLKDYHKDEVRELGTMLGLPESLVWRQPFPGPGLAVRIICTEKPYLTEDFEKIEEKLKTFETKNLEFGLIPIQTVGVQGDGRTYNYLAGMYPKNNLEGLDKISEIDWKEAIKLAREIPKKIHQINRIVFVFEQKPEKPQKTIIPTLLEPEVIEQLQIADDIVNQILQENNLIKNISQVPVISFPVGFDKGKNLRSIAIRTFITNDFMTGIPATPGEEMPFEVLTQMVKQILDKTPNVARVAYDLTAKPPGTTEWE